MPPAALLNILQKGLQYTEAEITIGEDGEIIITIFLKLYITVHCIELFYIPMIMTLMLLRIICKFVILDKFYN